MAICIEDSSLVKTCLGGIVHIAGTQPHNVRVQLMRQHLADNSADVHDMLNDEVYNSWIKISQHNSIIYDELDGDTSMYRTRTIESWTNAYTYYCNPSILDPAVKSSVMEIKGFLVDYPKNLLMDEDCSPPMTVRAVVPNELWS